MTEDLPFTKPEPTKFRPELLKLGMEYETDEYISWSVEKQHYDNFNSISKELRQKVLNRWREGGISVGDVAKEFKLDSKVVGDVIYLNIKNVAMLNTDSY